MDGLKPLIDLRFADDILLVATSLKHISSMIGDLSTEAGKVGLQLHPDKTKILSHWSPHDVTTKCSLTIHNMDIEIIQRSGFVKYFSF